MMDKDKETVLGYFEDALNKGQAYVNFWYEPNGKALRELIKEGVITRGKIGSLNFGYIYKDYLFEFREGSGDCVELLVRVGKVT